MEHYFTVMLSVTKLCVDTLSVVASKFIPGPKHSSLLDQTMSDEEEMFVTLTPVSQFLKQQLLLLQLQIVRDASNATHQAKCYKTFYVSNIAAVRPDCGNSIGYG